jgi:hypothetical protein
MPSFNDDHLGFSGPELNHAGSVNFTAAGGKSFSMHNPVLFESTAKMAHLPVDDTVTRAVGVDGSGNLVNTSKVVDADITTLTAAVNTKADTSVVTALTAVVATKASSTVVGSKASQVEVDSIATTVADKAEQSALDALTSTVGTKADDSAVVKTSGDQAISGVKTFSSGVRVDVTGDLTGLHLAGNHDDTNNHGGKLRLTKFKADTVTAEASTVIYQDGATLHGNTNLVTGCTSSGTPRTRRKGAGGQVPQCIRGSTVFGWTCFLSIPRLLIL